MMSGAHLCIRSGGGCTGSRSCLLGRTALAGALALAIALAVAPSTAAAGPQGTVVVGGAVDIQQSGAHTEFTQHSATALLNHSSFDIQTHESVNFAQPSSGALAVNRVVGNDLSTSIAGRLTANGNVWVLNPSGVAIHGTAQINVGGLLATTASISDDAVLAGERTFAGAPAGSAVTNAGTIQAGRGSVVLVAPVVSNTGTIAANGSDVALGAGSGFTVDFQGDALTRFEVAPASGISLTNSGTISAEGGAAYISAASAAAVQTSVVSIGGRVEATRAEERGGVIHISGGHAGVTEVSGALDASQASGEGGRIAVTGELVDIKGTATIDASGQEGGGTIEIGGGFQGAPVDSPVLARAGAPASAPLPTARRAAVREGARLAANAGEQGDGGTVIVWADEATGFRGAIEARGGALSGDGGFAEVSGRQGLVFDGTADLAAPAGTTGTLLLDPDTVTIIAGAGAQDGEFDGDNEILSGDMPAGFTISAAAVAQSVDAANTLIHATQTITQDAAVSLSGGNSLTYRTDSGDITLNAALTGTGNTLVIDAGGAVALSDLAVAALDVSAGGGIGQQPGTATEVAGATSLSAGGDIALGSANDFSTVDASGQAVHLGDRNAIRLGQITASSLAVTAGGTITDTGGKSIAVLDQTSLTAESGGTVFDIALDGDDGDAADRPHDFSSSTAFSARGRNIAVADATGIRLGEVTAGGDLSVLAGGAIGQAAGTTIHAPGDSRIETVSGGITLDRQTNDFPDEGSGHAVALHAPGAIVVADTDSIALGASSGASLAVTATDLAIGGALSFGGGTVAMTNRQGDGVRLGAAAADANPLTFEITDAEIAGIQAAQLTVATAGTPTEGIAVEAVTLDGESLTLASGAGPTMFTTAATSVAGGLTVSAASIGQDANGALAVAGTTRLTAAGAVALGDTQNDFDADAPGAGDATDEVDASGTAVTLVDRDAIALGEIEASSLEVRAGGSITDTPGKSIVVAGETNLTALSLADGFDIRLDNAGSGERHDFGGPVNAHGEDISLANGGSATRLGVIRPQDDASRPGATVDATIGNGNDGDLTVVSLGGPILDVAGSAIVVPGTTDLQAGGGSTFHDIALDEPGLHDFAEADPFDASGADVAVTEGDGIRLGRITAGGALTVTAGGSITDSPGRAIVVSGIATLTAQNGGNFFDIALDGNESVPFDRPHDFGGAVSARGEDIVLHDRDGIVLGMIDANESGQDADNAAADNTIALYDHNGDGLLDGSDRGAAGDLTVRAGGAIGDTGAPIDVEGRTRLEARAGATVFDITLDGPHDFDSNASLAGSAAGDAGQRVDAVGRNVTLVDANAIVLGNLSASGDLSVAAGGSVTDTPDGAIVVGDLATIRAEDPATADFFDVALDNGLHDLDRVELTGEGIRIVDRQDLTIRSVTSRSDDFADPTIGADGIFLEASTGSFAFDAAPNTTPLDAVRDVTLLAPGGSFDGGKLPDGLTFRSGEGGITLDLRDGFVVEDVPGTVPFTLDAPLGVSRIRIGADGAPEFFGIGTAGFLEQAQRPDFNPFFNAAPIGDIDLFRVTGDFALIARVPLTARVQNTVGAANVGGGTMVDGTTYLGGAFSGISLFGSFGGAGGRIASLEGFRDAAEIGEIAFVPDQMNTANGCAILVPSACQPLGSLLPTLSVQDGLLLGIRFVDPREDLDDPFTNRGDEEEWE